MVHLLIFFLSIVIAVFSERTKMVHQEGDVMIGVLLPIHRAGDRTSGLVADCGRIWEQYGIHRLEQLFLTVDDINNSSTLLPNITLGFDVRDSCWTTRVALEQCMDFIRSKLASLDEAKQHHVQTRPQTTLPTSALTPTQKRQCRAMIQSAFSTANEKPIAGLIGPGSSGISMQIQNVLHLFHIPQIGYSATSQALSDKDIYTFFMRVVPSDSQQARALVDLVLHYNWTYISTVYTEGNYGESGIKSFVKQLKVASKNTCVANTNEIKLRKHSYMKERDYENALDEINAAGAKVVICFCEGGSVRGLLNAISHNEHWMGKFLFIGSDGWGSRMDVVKGGLEKAAAGGMSIRLHSPPMREFDDYFLSLNPVKNTRNPWFREFWEEVFKCKFLPRVPSSPTAVGLLRPVANQSVVLCTGKENLRNRQSYEGQDTKLSLFENAIYAAAYGLHNMYNDLCSGFKPTPKQKLCPYMNPVNGSLYKQYLMNVSFSGQTGETVHFDKDGDGPGRYDIMNFQPFVDKMGNVTYRYLSVGSWDRGKLVMADLDVYWPDVGKSTKSLQSICSKACPRGYIKKIWKSYDKTPCCWECVQCEPNNIVIDETTCRPCPRGWWPNSDLTACFMINVDYMHWDDTDAIVAVVFSCAGLLFTLWITWVFITHNDTPVVKASTRELSYIILGGVAMAYSTTFPLIAKPSMVSCYYSRIMPGLSFSLVYGALVTKTNRIARILAGSKKKIITRKPRFLSASAQLLITSIIIGIECVVITAMLILEPADSMLDYPTDREVQLICNTTQYGLFIPLGFDALLITLCTLYAVRTRNLPENFNEAKFIGFTMYTTCIVWLSFVPIYFGSESQVITLCMAISISASVALILLFGPKVYIIIWKPERNVRGAFSTAGKNVRCHIGESNSIKSLDNAAMTVVRQKKALSRWRRQSSANANNVTVRPRAISLALAKQQYQPASSRPMASINENHILEDGVIPMDDGSVTKSETHSTHTHESWSYQSPHLAMSHSTVRRRSQRFVDNYSQTEKRDVEPKSPQSCPPHRRHISSQNEPNENSIVDMMRSSSTDILTRLMPYNSKANSPTETSEEKFINIDDDRSSESEILINLSQSPSVSRHSNIALNQSPEHPKVRLLSTRHFSSKSKEAESVPLLHNSSEHSINSDKDREDFKSRTGSSPCVNRQALPTKLPNSFQSKTPPFKSSPKKMPHAFSANSLSSADSETYVGQLSPENTSTGMMRLEQDEENIRKLQTFLHQKGMNLNIDEVQTADV